MAEDRFKPLHDLLDSIIQSGDRGIIRAVEGTMKAHLIYLGIDLEKVRSLPSVLDSIPGGRTEKVVDLQRWKRQG